MSGILSASCKCTPKPAHPAAAGVETIQYRTTASSTGTAVSQTSPPQHVTVSHLHAQVLGPRDDLIAKVIGLREAGQQQLLQRLGTHDIDAHGRDVGLGLGTVSGCGQQSEARDG